MLHVTWQICRLVTNCTLTRELDPGVRAFHTHAHITVLVHENIALVFHAGGCNAKRKTLTVEIFDSTRQFSKYVRPLCPLISTKHVVDNRLSFLKNPEATQKSRHEKLPDSLFNTCWRSAQQTPRTKTHSDHTDQNPPNLSSRSSFGNSKLETSHRSSGKNLSFCDHNISPHT